nr:AAA family ATPase [uncultured Blautia sp.]
MEDISTMNKMLPIGVDIFEKLRKDNYYYVDKTGMIKELLENKTEVTLFTRPRRFGKTLNMTMLKSFFSITSDPSIFQGLEITREKQLCEKYMGKYPVIFLSLKSIDAYSYEDAYQMAVSVMNEAAWEADYLLKSDNLSQEDKEYYRKLRQSDMNTGIFSGSLKGLSRLLEKHYGKKVVILIDEYDVPLSRAFENGYYDEMVSLLRGLFGNALKTNESLELAVMTGCLRVSKESIFTGLNNLHISSVTNVEFEEYFGFSDQEIRKLLEDLGLCKYYQVIKEWYDGYRFGNTDIYCPWDVICYCRNIMSDPELSPQDYWINTSSNSIVKALIQKSDNRMIRREIEELLSGGEVIKEIRQELTYPEMYASVENIWSVLFTTGYLTQRGKSADRMFRLVIPNREIQDIFRIQILECFKENVKKDEGTLEKFCNALARGDADFVEAGFNSYLKKTISIRDTFVRNDLKENFYHGILLGILGMKDSWGVSSNRESGNGYSDILVEPENPDMGIIIEVKYAHDGNLEKACREALTQIQDNAYEQVLKSEGVNKILKYGIACYLKQCKVKMLCEECN